MLRSAPQVGVPPVCIGEAEAQPGRLGGYAAYATGGACASRQLAAGPGGSSGYVSCAPDERIRCVDPIFTGARGFLG